MRNLIYILTFCFLIVLSACHDKKPVAQVDTNELKTSLEKANRYLINDEEEDINNYISRHNLDMIATGTGLRYQIIKPGSGELIQPGQTVTMEYVLNDIRGDVIYTSETEGDKKYVVGHSDVETGLDEVARYLRLGDVAKVIIPSHLGYGLLGDQKSIPERATLIYTIKIKDIQ